MRAILLAAVLLAGCTPTETLYWVKSDGTRIDKNPAQLSQLDQAKAVCQHSKADIVSSGAGSTKAAGSTKSAKAAKPSAVVSYPEDADITSSFGKGDTIDKSIQAKLIFDACMKDRGYRKSPGRTR